MVRSIEYNDGGNPLNYKSVTIDRNKTNKLFDSGDFVKDWYDALKWFLQSEFELPLVNSSSVDHFIMDGAPYDSAYLLVEDNKPSLMYGRDYADNIELFVPEGTTPTWEELRKLCGDEKKTE